MKNTDNNPSTSLLLLNGGVGQRAKHSEPKQFYELLGHPMMAYSLIAALKVTDIKEIVINSPKDYEARTRDILSNYAGSIPFKVVECGQSRQQSAYILAEAATYNRVILHEAARPMVTAKMYRQLLDHQADNVGFFSDIPFSMCQLDGVTGRVVKNVRRERVSNIQLPQKFDRSTLVEAHKAARTAKKTYTEDAVLVFKMTNSNVASITGPNNNIKVTTRDDFIIAEHFLSGAAK